MSTCHATPDGRALLGRHAEGCEGLDSGCLPCPSQHCRHCGTQHAEVTCPSCLSEIRENLGQVYALTEHLADEATHGRIAYQTHDTVPGGNALVMLGPGADRHAYFNQLAYRMAQHLDVSHTDMEHRDDPRPPLALLANWADRWRHTRGQTASRTPTMDSTVDYLGRNLHEAARHPAILGFAGDLEALVRSLEDVLHDGDRAETTRVPCLRCGTRLEKVYGITEGEDHYRCPGCRDLYNQGRYDRAKHDQLASLGAERYVLLTDAIGAIGRPEQTVRSWIRRGKVRALRHPETRRLLVWWPDVRMQHRDHPRRRPAR